MSMRRSPPPLLLERSRAGRGRREAQRGIRDEERVVDLLHDDLGRRRHAGAQQQVGIVEAQHGRIGDDVVDRLRRDADRVDLGREAAVAERLDGEGRVLPLLHLPDVRLVDVDLKLHGGEVLRDGEEHRRLQRGGDRLPGLHGAAHHHAVDRRADGRLLEIGLGGEEVGLGDLDVGLGHGDAGDGALIGGLAPCRASAAEAKFFSVSASARS